MKPRLLIVDDELPARARLKTLLSDIAGECPHDLVGECDSAKSAIEEIEARRPDIVLLDVQMPGMDGISLAKQVAKTEAAPPAFIFVTAYDDYALNAFEVHAFDYLLKPVRASRLADAIRRVVALRGQAAPAGTEPVEGGGDSLRSVRQHFAVQERGRLLLVPVSEVLYLKAELKYVTLRTATQEHLIEESLTSIEEELAQTFVRVHRNALVARAAIAGVERGSSMSDAEGDGDKAQDSWQVILRGIEERLPISRRQWSVVKALVR